MIYRSGSIGRYHRDLVGPLVRNVHHPKLPGMSLTFVTRLVRDLSHLEPSALLTLITWDGIGTESTRRELDLELGRWGKLDNTNVNYVVQPYYIPANFVHFHAPPGPYTHSFQWEPGKVTFSSVAGSANTGGGRVINRHVFTSGVPTPGGESIRIALYVFHLGQIPLKDENEVVIDKFEYLP